MLINLDRQIKIYVFIISKKIFKIIQLKIGTKKVEDHAQRWLEGIENKAENREAGLNLYRALIKPIEKYLDRSNDIIIIPDGILDLGRADDSGVVRAVLIQHERAFAIYAGKQSIDWATITSQP